MSDVHFLQAASVLPSHDVHRALAYYRDVLGFAVKWEPGEQGDYAIVERGPASVHLTNARIIGNRLPGNSSVYFFVADADALHAEFAARGARELEVVQDQVYGMRDFSCLDPDGNHLGFGHALANHGA